MDRVETKEKRHYGRLDLVCDVVSVVCLLVMFILIALYWGQLPEQIPTHYGIDGQPNAWGGRGAVLILPLLSLFLFAVLTGARFLPASMYNFPVAVTEENRERLLDLGREMLSVVKACLLLAFLPMIVFLVLDLPLPVWYTVVLLLLIFVPIVVYIIRVVKNK